MTVTFSSDVLALLLLLSIFSLLSTTITTSFSPSSSGQFTYRARPQLRISVGKVRESK